MNRYLLAGATLVTLSLLLFAKLVAELLAKELIHFDSVVGGWIIFFRASWLTPGMIFLTNLGSGYVLVGLVIVITFIGLRFRHRLRALGLDICMLGAFMLTELLKTAFHRVRPVLPWLTQASGFSFPSGHSLLSAAMYGFLAYWVLRNINWPRGRFFAAGGLIALAVGIGISRIYLGVHYPSDVLAGWAVATAWVGTCVIGVELFDRKFSRTSSLN